MQKGLESTEAEPLHLSVAVAAPAEEVLVDAAMVSGEELAKESGVVAKETQPCLGHIKPGQGYLWEGMDGVEGAERAARRGKGMMGEEGAEGDEGRGEQRRGEEGGGGRAEDCIW